MAELLPVQCSSCRARYALPDAYRQHVEGRALLCAACGRWWVPVPDPSGPPVKLVDGRPQRLKLDLGKFRRSAPPSPPSSTTVRVPVTAPGRPTSLRVVVAGPDADLKGVFDLGSGAFLIGRGGCHLNLPQASIPPQAIRLRRADRGFTFEGLAGFAVPIGAVSVHSGQIDPGTHVDLELGPYKVRLEPSATPGSPIADLGQGAAAPPPASPPAAAPAPRRRPVAPPSPASPAVDLRDQVQELAVDVRPDQPAFDAEAAAAVEADLDQTFTDLGASGFQAMRYVSDPLAGLDLCLVRAEGATKGQRFRITKSPLLIGRSEGDLVIRDRRVSSKHAQLDVAGPRVYTLKDLASTNGTTVNDRPISVGHLRDGDVISFGGVRFEFLAKQVK
jgi:hypothetical protein